jgi:hypothetical protein
LGGKKDPKQRCQLGLVGLPTIEDSRRCISLFHPKGKKLKGKTAEFLEKELLKVVCVRCYWEPKLERWIPVEVARGRRIPDKVPTSADLTDKMAITKKPSVNDSSKNEKIGAQTSSSSSSSKGPSKKKGSK